MFSHLIDDEDLEFAQRDFITFSQGSDYYRLGLKVFTRLAREAGATYKLGHKMVRVNRHVFEEYLRKVRKIEEGK